MKKKIIAILFTLLFPLKGMTHCPLCTVGAGAAGGLAVWLGVSQGVVGVFIGAFGFAMGFVIAKKFPIPNNVLGVISFLVTVIPLKSLFGDNAAINFSETVIVINQFLLGAIFGVVTLFLSPYISQKLTEKRGRSFSFQTMILTFVFLVIVAIISELLVF